MRAEARKRMDKIEKVYGVKIKFGEEQAVQSPATPVDSPVVKELSAAIKKVTGKKARPIGIGGGTVGGYLRIKGYSAAVWSTLDEMAHQPNEYCKIKNLMQDAKVLAAVFGGESL